MPNSFGEDLTILQTPVATRSMYDSVCYCNRCGMCASACPSYKQMQQEPFSPRGRNQILRQLLSGKLKIKGKERKLLQQIIASCTLCGRCVQNCPGQIPTPQHVLELRRRLKISLLPVSLFYLLRLRQTAPNLFVFMVRAGLLFRRVGFLRVLSYMPGLTWMGHLLEVCPPAAKISEAADVANPTLIYLPSLEAEFLMPSLFERTYRLAKKAHCVRVWKNTSSGLFEYVYGDIRRARKLLRKLMIRHANLGNGKIPLLTDSIDVYNFLQQTPQLFAGFTSYEQKALNFASCVRYVTDLFPASLGKKKDVALPVQLCPSVAFVQGSSLQQKTQQILATLFKKNFVECGYNDEMMPPLGYGFMEHTCAPVYALAAVRAIAAHQIQTVFVLSGFTALELAFYAGKFYPAVHVRHLVELSE